MTHEAGRSDHPHPFPRRTLALFALAVILPGAALAGLGVFTLRQDHSLGAQRVRERRDVLADRAATALDLSLREWSAALAAPPRGVGLDPALVPPALQAAVQRSESAALVVSGPEGIAAWPRGRLLYELPRPSAFARPQASLSPELTAAERIELRDRDLARAADAYRRLLPAKDAANRAEILLRLARTLAKADQDDLAAAAYRELAQLPGTSADGVPLDLLARCALCVAAPVASGGFACASAVYADLVDGKWRLDRTWYWAYSEQLRGALSSIAGRDSAAEKTAAREASKQALTLAVEAVASTRSNRTLADAITIHGTGDQAFIAWSAAAPVGWRAVVLPVSVLSNDILPSVLEPYLGEAEIRITAADGSPLLSTSQGPLSRPVAGPVATRIVTAAGAAWRIDVGLRNLDALLADYWWRRWLYVAMLCLMVASLAVGTVLTMRTVSRELAVARMKSQFVSAVSHEFRTPLTGIRHYGEMLLHDRVATEERKRHYYAQVVGAAERLSRLVEDLLDFARMEDGRQEYAVEPIETAAWLRRVASEIKATLPSDRRLECTIPDGLPGLRGDGAALGRAVQNLLDNAVKYSPGSSVVWLSARAEGASLIIDVRDEGVGIPADEQPHVFERFFRGRELGSSTRGTGLGLSIVSHIVAAHHGRVSFTSEVGRGTTMTITLPVADAEKGRGA